MNNTSLADSYLKLSGLDSALSKLVSEFAATQLQSLGANSLKNSLDIPLYLLYHSWLLILHSPLSFKKH